MFVSNSKGLYLMPPVKEDTQLEKFHSCLTDIVAVCEKLSSHVTSLEDLVGMINLALENQGQLKMLFTIVMGQSKGK